MSNYRTLNHSKFLLKYHIIFVCKYRRKLLIPYGDDMKQIMLDIAATSDFDINGEAIIPAGAITTNNDVVVSNTGALIIGDVIPLSGVLATNGSVTVSAASPLTQYYALQRPRRRRRTMQACAVTAIERWFGLPALRCCVATRRRRSWRP